MRVLRKEFTTVDNYSYYANALRRCIDTTYIPTGNSVEEVINNFTKTQLSRSFTCGFSNALLNMTFDENALSIRYVSTSGTEVYVSFEFDSDMEFSEGYLEVDISDDRAKPGRTHYERITKEFYEYTWKLGGQPPVEGGIEDTALYPEWLFDKESNKTSIEEKTHILKDMGYKPLEVIGMLNAWKHTREEPVRYKYILEITKDEFKLLENEKDLFTRSYGAKNWRRLIEILKNDNEPEEDYDEEDDYVDVEDEDYDEEDDYVDVEDEDYDEE